MRNKFQPEYNDNFSRELAQNVEQRNNLFSLLNVCAGRCPLCYTVRQAFF